MPLGQGIAEVLRAIPPRIEVASHGDATRVTAGSFDAALEFAREAYGSVVALDVEARNRLWPRVTVTVTTDPDQATGAPAVEELRDRAERQLEAAAKRSRGPQHRADPEPEPAPHVGADPDPDSGESVSVLEEIFAHQEELRLKRSRIPVQRRQAD